MARLQWKIMNLPSRLLQQLHNLLVWLKLLRKTLFYNHFTSFTVALETVVEPMFWSVERFAKYLGPIFVTLVVCLTTSVVVIFYICLLPHVYEQSLSKTVFHLIFGHWLLMNIVFNYVLAAFTDPGSPPLEIPETVSICKKCISPKPPRAHHCSVCNRCILKMDHHCPWLNNCIGFFNHRYFFQFCCYMFFGTVYVCVTGVDLFKQHFYGDKEYPFPGALYPLNLAYEIIYGNNEKHYIEGGNLAAKPHKDDLELNYNQQPYHSAVVYEFIICSAVAVALLLLILWHMKMISSGETNIEVHINKKETQRLKKKGLVYKNPYHYGFIKNWRNFFALTEERSFWRCVLLPSLHKPIGNGLSFPRAVYKFDSEKGLQLL